MKRLLFATILMAVLAAAIVGCNQQSTTDVSGPPVAAESKSDSIPAPADALEPEPTATPTPLSTATPKPEPTATPTLIPTNTPTPEPPEAADYENDRLAQVLSGDRPDVIVAEAREEKPGGVVQRIEFAMSPASGDFWLSVSFENSDLPASLQFLVVGDRGYLRGHTGEEEIDWITGPASGGLEGDSLAADFTPGASLADTPLIAIAVETCGDGRFCFLLENPEDPSRLLLVDAQSYLPVAIRNIGDDGEPTGSQVDLTWGGEFDFSPPDGGAEVDAEELGTTLFVLLISLASAETVEEEVPPPDTEIEGQQGNRAAPLPAGSTIAVNDFSIEILEVLRGDEALENVLAASDSNDPPAAGFEYVQIHVRMTYEGTESSADTGEWDFRLTGSDGVYRSRALVFQTEPDLNATLVPGGTADGWVAFEVPAAETDLMLIYDSFNQYTDDPVAYVAVDPGAMVVPDTDSFPVPTDTGLSRSTPAPIGEAVVNEKWEFTVLEVRRGDDLDAELPDSFSWIEELADGREYVAVRLRARYLGRVERTVIVSGFDLAATGSENVLYDVPFALVFEPEFWYEVFPGAVVEGWVTYEVEKAETNLILRLGDRFALDSENDRFLALVAGASVAGTQGRLAEQNSAGVEESSPAGMGVATVGPTWQIEVIQVVRGTDALDALLAANSFTDPPGDGFEYLLIEVDVRSVAGIDELKRLSEFNFQLFDADGTEIEMPFISVPTPGIGVDLFAGGQHRGWIVFAVPNGKVDLVLKVDPLYFDFAADTDASVRFFAIP